MTIKHRCQVSGCRRAAKWAFNTTLGPITINWYACEVHSKQHERDVGPMTVAKGKR